MVRRAGARSDLQRALRPGNFVAARSRLSPGPHAAHNRAGFLLPLACGWCRAAREGARPAGRGVPVQFAAALPFPVPAPGPVPYPSERSMKRLIWIVALVAVAAWLGEKLYTRFVLTATEPRVVTARGSLADQEKSVIELFQVSAPSVAYIFTETRQRSGMFGTDVAQGAGSGFVWDQAGHVVTNFHVVANADRINVQLDAGKPIRATLVGAAPEYDLAVVRLSEAPSDLRPIPIGTSQDLRIGQSVYAIGNPFGLSRTLTSGIVSALDRTLPTSQVREISGVIQSDAAINPGNSGGPLLDSAGRLIGVNTAILSGSGSSAGVGFSIPVDLVNRIVPVLIKNGKAPRPGIGIVVADQQLVARAGLTGLVIMGVVEDSPAAKAGLVPFDPRTGAVGDIIVAVEGKPVNGISAFVTVLDGIGIGKEAELTLRRGDVERRVKVKIVDVS
jgi:2-alkenal reductase